MKYYEEMYLKNYKNDEYCNKIIGKMVVFFKISFLYNLTETEIV